MTITITDPSTSTTSSPYLVLPYELEKPLRNLVFTVPDRADVEVEMRPAGLWQGDLQLLFLSLSDALECIELHTREDLVGALTYEDTANPLMSMAYIPLGTARLTQTDAVHPCVVTITIQEVPS